MLSTNAQRNNLERALRAVDSPPVARELIEKFVLTPEEAALLLGVSLRTIRYWVAERRIPFFHLGRFVRFQPAELMDFLEAGRVDPR